MLSCAAMTPEHLDMVLKTLKASQDKEGFFAVAEGSSLTLHLAHDGAALSISRVEGVKVDGDLVYARTQKKELFAFVRADVFAVAADGPAGGQTARKPAGFSV